MMAALQIAYIQELFDAIKLRTIGGGAVTDGGVEAAANAGAGSASSAGASPQIQALKQLRVLQTFPVPLIPNMGTLVEMLGSYLYPLALALPLPVCVYIGVLERATGLRELMRVPVVVTLFLKQIPIQLWGVIFLNPAT
jgi:hypothetical protein